MIFYTIENTVYVLKQKKNTITTQQHDNNATQKKTNRISRVSTKTIHFLFFSGKKASHHYSKNDWMSLRVCIITCLFFFLFFCFFFLGWAPFILLCVLASFYFLVLFSFFFLLFINKLFSHCLYSLSLWVCK